MRGRKYNRIGKFAWHVKQHETAGDGPVILSPAVAASRPQLLYCTLSGYFSC